jgi:cobalt-zinc-cadmium efflux system outer membrane protein
MSAKLAARSSAHAGAPMYSCNPPRLERFPLSLALGLTLAALGGCSLTPCGTDAERDRLAAVGQSFESPISERSLPELAAAPTWQDVLQRAFLANGNLEAAYFDWKAAVERIGIASAYPNSNVEFGYSYMFSSEQMKTFDRMTFSVGFDPMENLAWPSKVQQAGKIALDEARSAGERFRAAKFSLQRRVLTALAEYALLAERSRIEQDNLALLRLTREAAVSRVQTGSPQHELLRTEIDIRTSDDRLTTIQSELAATRAMLNGLLVREPNEPLEPEALYCDRRIAPGDDVAILASAAERNPDIAQWMWQVEGRRDALELARMQWIPDIMPSVMFTGSIAQAVGVAISLPTTIAEIQGTIRESQAMVRASEASLRQVRADTAAEVVATLISMRNSERQASLFRDTVLPIATHVVINVRQSYSAGSSQFIDMLDAQRTLLDVQLTIAEADAKRERRLAELESLLGVDIETVWPASAPTSLPVESLSSDASIVEVVRHD